MKYNIIGVSIIFGVVLGVALNNIGLWLSLSIAIGAAMQYTQKNKSKSEQSE